MRQEPDPPLYRFATAATAAMVLLGPLATLLALRPDLLLRTAPTTTLEGAAMVLRAFLDLPLDLLRASAGADPAGMNQRLLGFIPLAVGILAFAAWRGLSRREETARPLAFTAHGLVIAFSPLVVGAGTGTVAVAGLALAAVWALTTPEVRGVTGGP